MGIIATLIVTTALAGVVGTGLGGLIGALLQKDSNRTVSLLLSFAGGVMLSVVCFDLVTEAVETNAGIWFVVGAIAFGVAATFFLNYLIDRKTNPEVPHIDANHPKTADDLDELIHSDHFEQHYARNDGKLSLFVAGIVMAHKGETPGLGAEIATPKHQDLYKGKTIFEGDEFVGVTLRKAQKLRKLDAQRRTAVFIAGPSLVRTTSSFKFLHFPVEKARLFLVH